MKRLTKRKAIRAKCLDCCCGHMAEVRYCPATKCPLWPYRMGKEDTSLYDPGWDADRKKSSTQVGDFEPTDDETEEDDNDE